MLADNPVANVRYKAGAAHFRRFKLEVPDAVEQPFASSEDERRDVEPQFVDQSGRKELAGSLGTSSYRNVSAAAAARAWTSADSIPSFTK